VTFAFFFTTITTGISLICMYFIYVVDKQWRKSLHKYKAFSVFFAKYLFIFMPQRSETKEEIKGLLLKMAKKSSTKRKQLSMIIFKRKKKK